MASNVLNNYATAGIPSNIQQLCQQWISEQSKLRTAAGSVIINIAKDPTAYRIVQAIQTYGQRAGGYAGTTKKDMKLGNGNFADYAARIAANTDGTTTNFAFDTSCGLPWVQSDKVTKAFVDGVSRAKLTGRVVYKTGMNKVNSDLDKMVKNITKTDIMNPNIMPSKLEPLFTYLYQDVTNMNENVVKALNNILQQISNYTANKVDYADEFIGAAISGNHTNVKHWLEESKIDLSDYSSNSMQDRVIE